MTTTIWAYNQGTWNGYEKIGKKPRKDSFQTVPYYAVEVVHEEYAANTASFDSTIMIAENSPVIIRGSHKPFKGFIQKRIDQPGYYTYTCIDGQKRLFGNTSMFHKKVYPSDIVKLLLSKEGFVTSGVHKSPRKQPALAWNNAKVIDIIQQCAVIDGYKFYFNQDGIPIYQKPSTAIEGYIFIPENSITDYNLQYDTSNIITDVMVFGADNTYLARAKSQNMIAKYGDILEIITDSNITTTATAKSKALQEFTDKAKVAFTGTLTIPSILPIGESSWCAMAAPDWNPSAGTTIYYIQKVTTTINENTTEQKLDILDGKPQPPDQFVYSDSSGNHITCSSSTTGKDIVTGSMYPSATWCVKHKPVAYKRYTKSWKNYCPICKKLGGLQNNPKHTHEGEWTCKYCGADFDGVCGYEKEKKPRGHLTAATGTGSTIDTTCATAATGAVGKLQGAVFRSPHEIRVWIDQNIKYKFYYDDRYTPEQVLERARKYGPNVANANCKDQAKLFVALVNAYFPGQYPMQIVHCTCAGLGHYHTIIYINGRSLIADTTCHSENQL